MSRPRFASIDEYISSFPKDVQEILQTIRKAIKDEIPGAEEVISYQIPCFKLDGKYVVYFAGFKNHISMYPFSGEMEKEFKESAEYKTSGKGTIQFPLDKPLPLPLIRKITKHLVNHTKEKLERKRSNLI